ncbi:MAG: ABC transporter substrate-binding protein [Chloroflexi bacterium]|nr:ABC transporter substrate-binding protein [Chloroflexota bacterium]
MHRGAKASWLAVLILLLAACGPAATATPAPTPTLSPTPTPVAGIRATATPTTASRPGITATPTARPSPTPAVAASQPKHGGLLKTFTDREVRAWDGVKLKSGGRDVRTQHNLVFSLLFDYPATPENNCQLNLTPELAESFKWNNDTQLDVKLRSGVKFQNKPPISGRELTAEDAAASLSRAFITDTVRGMEAIAPHVLKIEAVDKYTVRFTTDGPLATLVPVGLPSVYGTVVVPKEFAEDWGDPYKHYIGTGPFAFSEYVQGVKVSYEKHPNYFKPGLPYVDKVDFNIMGDVSTRVAALRSGAIDLIWMLLPQAMAAPLEKAAGIQVQSCLQYLAMPGRIYMRTDKAPFGDIRVRRAMSMALNREGYLKAILQGHGVTAALYPPEMLPYHVGLNELSPETRRWVTYNPQEAKKLLAEAGYPNGFESSMIFNTAYTTPYPEVAQGMLADLAAIGIKVNPRWLAQAQWSYYVNSGDIDDMLFGTAGPADLTETMGPWVSTSPPSHNRSRIKDSEVDKLLLAFNREPDLNKAIQFFKQLEIRIIDQAWEITPGTYPMEFTAARSYVRDFRGGNYWYTSTFLERLWLDR